MEIDLTTVICSDCAHEKGWKAISQCNTVYLGTCDYCGEEKAVSTVKDWVWPGREITVFSWD